MEAIKKFTLLTRNREPCAVRPREAFAEERKESTINTQQVTDKRKSTRVYRENPIDSASAHWNSEAPVAERKSRWCDEKAPSSPSLSPSRVQGPKVHRSNLRNMEDAKRIGECEREISTHFAIGTSWCTTDTRTTKLCLNKVEGVSGTLISLRLARRATQSYAVCRIQLEYYRWYVGY